MAMALQTNIHIGEKLNAEVLKQQPLFTWSNISWNFGNLGLCKWIMMSPALYRRQNRPPRMLGWRKGYLQNSRNCFQSQQKSVNKRDVNFVRTKLLFDLFSVSVVSLLLSKGHAVAKV